MVSNPNPAPQHESAAYQEGHENGYLVREIMGADAPGGPPSDDEWAAAMPMWITTRKDGDAWMAGCRDGWAAVDDLAGAGIDLSH